MLIGVCGCRAALSTRVSEEKGTSNVFPAKHQKRSEPQQTSEPQSTS